MNVFRKLSSDDDASNGNETTQMLNTLYLNLFIFLLLGICFEFARHARSMYLNRATRRFQKNNRVPPIPPTHMFGWVIAIFRVSDDELLRMAGLDAYMYLRFINICLRLGLFFCFWGLLFLVPIYKYSANGLHRWDSFTIANIFNDPSARALWAPVLFCYIFAGYFCQLLYNEYKNFIDKRVEYLENGDLDSAMQASYTVMVEKVPANIKSAPALFAFFDKLFPGEVYSVEVALDLKELDELCAKRTTVRNQLEKAIAVSKALHSRPTMWVQKDYYAAKKEMDAASFATYKHNLNPQAATAGVAGEVKEGEPPTPDSINSSDSMLSSGSCDSIAKVNALDYPSPVAHSSLASLCGYIVVDRIEHLAKELNSLNVAVMNLQKVYFEQRHKRDELEESRILEGKTRIQRRIAEVSTKITDKLTKSVSGAANYGNRDILNNRDSVASEGSGIKVPKGDLGDGGNEGEMSPLHFACNTSESYSTTHVGLHGTESGLDDHLRTLVPPSAAKQESHSLQSASKDELERADSIDTHSSWRSYPLHSDDPSLRTSASSPTTMDRLLGKRTVAREAIKTGAMVIGTGVEGIAKEGLKHAQFATKGALRTVFKASQALELLTLGSNYKTSSTAFVTFKTRNAVCSSLQMLLSHKYYDMVIKPAPNPKDLLWSNVSIPEKQIAYRTSIADTGVYIGCLFWSIVVTAITAAANLTSISKEIPSLQEYANTSIYKFLNDYLAIAILLILLAILPAIFDLVARYYEGLKLESEIQNSIMTRYFYYQLANVFVSVGLGSVANSLHEVLNSPTSILTILGTSLPSFSIYFVSFVIVKTLTAVPIEMLRVIPLLDILIVMLALDKKKCTRRELRTGAFADPPMLYGWCYPNQLMILMIMVTYSCIAPFLMPFCTLFFFLAYMMYKYQLLYVYINESQSGGFMWYAVFGFCMIALIMGVCTLLAYLAIRQTYETGEFYVLFPLPFLVAYFWRHCDQRFRLPALTLSLEGANAIDDSAKDRLEEGIPLPHAKFKHTLFRQPSLAEGKLRPAAYRAAGASSGSMTGDQLEEGILSPNSKDRLPEEEYFSGADYDAQESEHHEAGAAPDEDEGDSQRDQEVNDLLTGSIASSFARSSLSIKRLSTGRPSSGKGPVTPSSLRNNPSSTGSNNSVTRLGVVHSGSANGGSLGAVEDSEEAPVNTGASRGQSSLAGERGGSLTSLGSL